MNVEQCGASVSEVPGHGQCSAVATRTSSMDEMAWGRTINVHMLAKCIMCETTDQMM